jgi:cell wall-associated NlpC family hydrolase
MREEVRLYWLIVAHPAVRHCLIAVLTASLSAPLRAQRPGFEASVGYWWTDSGAVLYSVGLHRPLLGPFDWGIGVAHLEDANRLTDHTQTGGDLSLGIHRTGRGPYAVGTGGLAMRHQDGNLDASWSAGLGWAIPVFSFLAVGVEARYRTEDQDARGFWRLLPTDRRGLALELRVSTGSIARRRTTPTPAPPQFEPPSQGDLINLSRDRGATPDNARVAADVVRTAIGVMGTPYTWGGDDTNGYDCSGLIQYAYGQHGIILPRISRDQVRMGRAVERRLEALRPGDILGFSVEGDQITHVGLYVGEGEFIHSASGGVKLSSLSATDGDSLWWRRHWAVARRILGS